MRQPQDKMWALLRIITVLRVLWSSQEKRWALLCNITVWVFERWACKSFRKCWHDIDWGYPDSGRTNKNTFLVIKMLSKGDAILSILVWYWSIRSITSNVLIFFNYVFVRSNIPIKCSIYGTIVTYSNSTQPLTQPVSRVCGFVYLSRVLSLSVETK